jgi:flagellar hook-length control protein FliK
LIEESERCPVPRVASESNVVLPTRHNATVRHRTAGNDSGDKASPFAALVDSADAAAARTPSSRAPVSRASSAPATDRSRRPSEAPAAKNESTPDRANSSNTADAADAADAAPEPSQSRNEAGAADGTETQADRPDEKDTQDATATATDLLDLLTSTVADSGTPAPSGPIPPAAAVSVDSALTAQSAPTGETSEVSATPVAAPDVPTAPAAQSAEQDIAPAVDQPTEPEQSAPSSAATPDSPEATPTADGKTAVPASDAQPTATQASQDPVTVANEQQPAPEQAASKALTPSEPTATQADAPVAQTGKRPTAQPDPTPDETRKSDAATNVEDNDGKTAAPADAKDPAAPADRPIHAPRRVRAEAANVEDKQTAALAAGGHDASQKAPAGSVPAILLANDQASATATAQPAAAPTSNAMEPAVPIAGLAVEIAARAQAGQNRFEIRLDPPELGRIDVRLDIDSSGQVTSRLVVERADTLEHLRRDSAGLERALQDAGLKTAENGLQFSLRDQGFAGRDTNSQSPATAQLLVPDPDLAPVDIPANAYGRMMRIGGVDIRV